MLVGRKARGLRQGIRLALSSAKVHTSFFIYYFTRRNHSQDISLRNAVDRPFTPPIHVLILPSKLPLDFRLHFRDLDEEYMVCRVGTSPMSPAHWCLSPKNGGSLPDHMNLLVMSEAMSDVCRTL